MTPTERRHKLLAAGFDPLPLVGKRPVFMKWQQRTETSAGDIDIWAKLYADATNTGALTRLVPALDIDIRNPFAAEAVEELVRERFEERGYILVRVGQPPKRAIPFRTDTPFTKITANLIAPDGSTAEKLELLCDGQQIVVDGIHPDTRKPYTWHGGELGQIKREDLPYLSAEEASALVHDAVELLVRDHGYTQPKAKSTTGNGFDHSGASDWAELLDNVQHGRELHDSIAALSAKMIASGMQGGAVVNVIRAALECSTAPRDVRFAERIDDVARAVRSAEEKFSTAPPAPPPPLPFINMRNWDNEAVPPQPWTVVNRIPRRQCALFSGEGAAGKSTIELHRAVAHVLGTDWLGTMPEQGPAIFIDAEDDADVIHARLAAITNHYGVRFADLINRLHVISLAGLDAVLATVSRGGKLEATSLYKQLTEAAGDIRPISIGIASSANVFAGSEIDRSQVQQFIALLTRLAILADGAVTLISHPSLAGIANDSGLSGSTHWHNAVRARFYLKGVKPEAGEQPDNDLREIVFKKNNYGPVSESLVLRYSNGLFLPVPGVASLDRASAEMKADELFIELLRRFTAENRAVCDKSGTRYAPALFAREEEAKRAGIGGKAFEAALRRLFKAGRIWNEPHGRPSRGGFRLALKT